MSKALTMAWNWSVYPAVELIQTAAGVLQLRKAPTNADPNMTFGETELAALFATMTGATAQASADNLCLYGEEKNADSDFPKSLECANLKPNGYGKSYDAWQLAEYKPTAFAMRLKFKQPQLWVFCNDFRMSGGGSVKRAPLAIKRIDPNAKAEAPEAPKQPAKQPLQRRPANA